MYMLMLIFYFLLYIFLLFKYYFILKTTIMNNGERYEGNWADGECSGDGVYYFDNGDKTEGKFVKHKASGVHNRNLGNGQVQRITY